MGLGCSKGGFTSKTHLRVSIIGLPVATTISAGQSSGCKGYHPLMEEDGPEPKVLILDRGYDAGFIREDMEKRGGTKIIPLNRNRKVQIPVDGYVYALRDQAERCFTK